MKARLFVVNKETIKSAVDKKVVSTMVPKPVDGKNEKKKM